jgi:hypothetical protein
MSSSLFKYLEALDLKNNVSNIIHVLSGKENALFMTIDKNLGFYKLVIIGFESDAYFGGDDGWFEKNI